MIKADGEYVKIYLLILRLQGMGLPVDVERNYTELFHKRKNVKRNIYAWHWRAAVIVLLLGLLCI